MAVEFQLRDDQIPFSAKTFLLFVRISMITSEKATSSWAPILYHCTLKNYAARQPSPRMALKNLLC